ncbi:MAG: hypothetical protein QOJ07_2635, partial [Thermoleophilaceae bacterium]|nr:hypothetical protein [Thermoleophilaceae bacterium]
MPLPELPTLDGVRHSNITVNGVSIHLAEAGARDGDAIVMQHGWPQNWWCWHKLIPTFAGAGFRVICPDLRGHGWSGAPPGGYDKHQLAHDLIGVMDALGLERVKLVGHDWGAMAGFLACIESPDRFERFLALGIVPPFPSTNPRAPLHFWRFYYQFLIASGLPEPLFR